MNNLLSELQNGSFKNPQLEQLVLKLQTQLKISKGKKVYGYLQPNVKQTVNLIVAELSQNPVLKRCMRNGVNLNSKNTKPIQAPCRSFLRLKKTRCSSR